MDSGDNGNGKPPDVTPPAYLKQVEREQRELYTKHSNLKSLVQANHMAVLHSLGELATHTVSNGAAIAEVRADLLRMAQSVDKMAKSVDALVLHLGVA